MALVDIPAVGCNGDLAPDAASLPRDRQIDADVPVFDASDLEFYVSAGPLTLAPRGWVCDTVADGFEGTVSIHPQHSKSYGLTEVYIDGDSNNHTQANMDSWTNAYFANEMKKETLAGNGPISTESIKKYPTDKLKSKSSLVITYTTPANHLGVGNDILFGFGFGEGWPRKHTTLVTIKGFLKLFTRPGYSADHLELFAISSPSKLSNIASFIENYDQNQQ